MHVVLNLRKLSEKLLLSLFFVSNNCNNIISFAFAYGVAVDMQFDKALKLNLLQNLYLYMYLHILGAIFMVVLIISLSKI